MIIQNFKILIIIFTEIFIPSQIKLTTGKKTKNFNLR